MIAANSRADRQLLVAPDALDWQDADMTATFGAQVPFRQLDDHARLWLPVDCQGNPDATLGELVARNATGPLRLGFGAWRDLLLGCQYCQGDGRLVSAGGRTVKNVAGYDLTKFMVGQSGVYGTLATITTRVYRKPQDAILAEFAPDQAIFNRLIATPCRPQWAMITSDSLMCGYLGATRNIDYYRQHLPEYHPRRITRHGFAEDCRWRNEHWRITGEHALEMRASVPPMRIAEFAKLAKLNNWVAEAAFGIVMAGSEREQMEGISDAAVSVGGRAWFTELGTNGGEPRLVRCTASAGEEALLRRLKANFDPRDQLAPLPRIAGDE
jgi:hypothetical protein